MGVGVLVCVVWCVTLFVSCLYGCILRVGVWVYVVWLPVCDIVWVLIVRCHSLFVWLFVCLCVLIGCWRGCFLWFGWLGC